MGRRTRGIEYVAVAAGAILLGPRLYFSAHVAMPERATVPPSPPVATVAPPSENVTTELTYGTVVPLEIRSDAASQRYLTEIPFQMPNLSARRFAFCHRPASI